MNAARYLWQHPAGRLALLTIAATVLLILAQEASAIIGPRLGFHPGFPPAFGWPPYLLLAAIRRKSYESLRGPICVTRRRPITSDRQLPFRSSDDAE